MTIDDALFRINEMLYIGATVTNSGDELRIWTHDPEDGWSKDHLNRADLDRLIESLEVVRDNLK